MLWVWDAILDHTRERSNSHPGMKPYRQAVWQGPRHCLPGGALTWDMMRSKPPRPVGVSGGAARVPRRVAGTQGHTPPSLQRPLRKTERGSLQCPVICYKADTARHGRRDMGTCRIRVSVSVRSLCFGAEDGGDLDDGGVNGWKDQLDLEKPRWGCHV